MSIKTTSAFNTFIYCLALCLAVTIASADDRSTGGYAERMGLLQGKLNQPSDVAISDDGRAYVLDGVNGRVKVFTAEGKEDFAFRPVDKNKGKLNLPMGIAIANERVYIADSGNHRLVLFDLRGRFLTSFSLSARVSGEPLPEPVALVVNDDVISWSDRRNHRVCRTHADSGEQINCWGKRGEGKGEFQFPFQLALDRDNYLLVVDVLNGRVQQFNYRGRRFTSVGRFGLAPGELYRPNGLAYSAKGELLVSDAYRGTVSRYRNGRFVGLLGDKQGKTLDFEFPVALTAWRDRLYVVDAKKNRVEILRLHSTDAIAAKTKRTGQQSSSQKNCVSCHYSWATSDYPVEDEQEGVPPVATPRMCYSCHHGAVIDSRLTIGQGEQHPGIHHQRQEKETPRDDEIPEHFPLLSGLQSTNKQLSCGSCHTPHKAETNNADTLYASHENPWLRVLNNDGDLCQQCHESKLESSSNKKYPLKGINHLVGVFLKPPPEPNAKGFATNKLLHKGLPGTLLENGASLGHQQQLTCQSCHQIHGSSEESLTVLPFEDGQLCVQCHPRQHAEDEKEAREKGIHPVNIDLKEPVKMGNEKIKRVTCLSCHSVHAGKQGTPLLKVEHRDGQLCSYCHDGFDAVLGSDHDLRITAEKSKNRLGELPRQAGVCGACHTLHQGEANASFLSAAELENYSGKEPALERDKLCLNCHREKGIAEKAVVEHFSHPSSDLVLRSETNVMPLIDGDGEIKTFGSIACITCHNPHRWIAEDEHQLSQTAVSATKTENQKGTVLNSFLRRKGAKGTFCIDCHGLDGHLKYKYYHDEFTRDLGVDYIK